MAAKGAGERSAAFKALPLKQQTFVLEYLLNGFNATQAAKTAGYSERTADSQGSRLLKDVKVGAVLGELTGKALAKREITAERVLDELAKLAFRDVREMFREDDTLRPVTDMDDDAAAGIMGIEVSEIWEGSGDDRVLVGHLKKIKLADKGINLERLGRHLKLFTDKVEHTGNVGVQLLTSVPRPERGAKK